MFDRSREEMNRREKSLCWFISAVPVFTLTILSVLVISDYREAERMTSTYLVGNRASSVRALQEKGLPFSFLVIGDLQSSERAMALVERGLKESDASFVIILGDFVSRPDLWHHRLFLNQMTARIKPSIPVFLVPGNHDIDYKASRAGGDRVTAEIYESLYGARNFSFVFNESLFIIAQIEPGKKAVYLDFIRETLSQKGTASKHTFIFMHSPPQGLAESMGVPYPNQEEVFSLLESYKVTSVFFGDYHGYWRGERRGTNLIVSGGGGRLKESQPEWGKFNHMLRMTVHKDMISEGILPVQGKGDSLRGILKKFDYIHLFPLIQDKGWILYILFSLSLFGSIFFVAIGFRSLWKRNEFVSNARS